MNIPGRKYFNGEIVLSDWFPRGGDNAIFRVERIASSSSPTGGVKLLVTFNTKNMEDEGDGAEIIDPNGGGEGYFIVLNPGDDGVIGQTLILSETSGSDVVGMKEMVRLKFQAIDAGSGTEKDWVMARCFPPIFFDDAKRMPSRS